MAQENPRYITFIRSFRMFVEFVLFAIFNGGSKEYLNEDLPDWYRKYIL